MSQHGLPALAVRISGILIGLYAVKTGTAFIYSARESGEDQWLWLVLTPFAMMGAASLIMIAFPYTVAAKITPEGPSESDGPTLSPGEIERLACSLAGLYFLVQAVIDASYLISFWIASQQYEFNIALPPTLIGELVATLVEFCVAVWLLFGGATLVSFLNWARRAQVGERHEH